MNIVFNKWTYNPTDHLIKGLETIILLATMIYTVNLDAYELHRGDEIHVFISL